MLKYSSFLNYFHQISVSGTCPTTRSGASLRAPSRACPTSASSSWTTTTSTASTTRLSQVSRTLGFTLLYLHVNYGSRNSSELWTDQFSLSSPIHDEINVRRVSNCRGEKRQFSLPLAEGDWSGPIH